jgi:hypothetical protein
MGHFTLNNYTSIRFQSEGSGPLDTGNCVVRILCRYFYDIGTRSHVGIAWKKINPMPFSVTPIAALNTCHNS